MNEDGTMCNVYLCSRIFHRFSFYFQDLEHSVIDHQPEIEFINSVAEEIFHGNKEDRLQIEVKELNTRWTDIPALLRERCSKLENGKITTSEHLVGKTLSAIYCT